MPFWILDIQCASNFLSFRLTSVMAKPFFSGLFLHQQSYQDLLQ